LLVAVSEEVKFSFSMAEMNSLPALYNRKD